MRRALLVLAILAASIGVTGAQASTRAAAGCPDELTCKLYSVGEHRWATKKGIVTIPYWIYSPQPWFTHLQLRDAADRAAKAWQRANPNVRFQFEGFATELPALGNGLNEIAFVPTLEPGIVAQSNHRVERGVRVEADTLLNMVKPWAFRPCGDRDGSCSNAFGTGLREFDLQAMLTQQFGVWLGMRTLSGEAAKNLTMYAEVGYGERHKSTLALGDVLGIRRAYPCGSCRGVKVYTP